MSISLSYGGFLNGQYSGGIFSVADTVTDNFPSGQPSNPNNDPTNAGTVSQTGSTFVAGQAVTASNYFDQQTYVGYVTVSGVQYMVLSDGTGSPTGSVLLYTSSSAPSSLTSSLTLTSPVTAQDSAFCILTGTLILTVKGDVPVENLKIGDELICADGSTTPVFWIGKKTMTSVFTTTDNLPVEIRAGALGSNIPQKNLRLMPAHPLLIKNTLVVAGQLVNGISIRRLAPSHLGETFTYYAIETEGHSVILADGTPVESKGNIKANAGAFDNWDEYVSLYGENGRDYPVLPNERIRMIDEVPEHIDSYLNDLVLIEKAA